MEAFVGLLSLIAAILVLVGIVLLIIPRWRPSAQTAILIGLCFFAFVVFQKDGFSGFLAFTTVLSIGGFGAGLFLSLIPKQRSNAATLLKACTGSFVVSFVLFAMINDGSAPEKIESAPKTITDQSEPGSPPKEPADQYTDIAGISPQPPNVKVKKPKNTSPLPIKPFVSKSLGKNEPLALVPAPETGQKPPKLPTKTILKSEIMYVDATRLNVRNGPSKKHKVIWTLKNDEKVSVVNRQGSWAKLQSDRYVGWVFATYLTPKPAQPKAVGQTHSAASTTTVKPRLSDAAIADILIERSLAYYDGKCPCPYNRARNGSRCGRRSAYSRPGGAEPLCYAKDVTDAMIANYRARQ